MRVVVVGPHHPDSLPQCVLDALRRMGHEAHPADEREMLGVSFQRDVARGRLRPWTRMKLQVLGTLMKASPRFELRVYGRLCRIVESHRPELVITHSAWIPPQAVRRMKEATGAAAVCWFPDHPGNLGRQYLMADCYDALFFKDKFLVEMARRINRNAFYLPECCEPHWHHRVTLSPEEGARYECDVTIAANLYYYRAAIFERLMEVCHVKIWGPPVPRWMDSPARAACENRPVAQLEKAKAFCGAKIVVNTFQGEVAGVNLRTFEAAGCGAFQICEHRRELEELFVPGEEIEVFHSLDDLVEKVRFYLATPEERSRIAENGRRRAHAEHTYERRLERILQVVSGLRGSREGPAPRPTGVGAGR